MAEANDDEPDCENCEKGPRPAFASRLNFEAVNCWRFLDAYARDIDTFAGVPKPLRLEAVEIECGKNPDAAGLAWRVWVIEEKMFAKRIREYDARAGKGK